MADFGGGIPGQVASELTSIPKAVVKDAAKAVGSIASGTAEALASAGPTSPGLPGAGRAAEGKAQEMGQSAADPLAVLHQQKEAAAKKRLSEVRQELQDYFESQKKQEEQMEVAVEEQKKEEKIQMAKSKKKMEEEEVLRRLGSQYGGTGETAKSGG